MFYFNRISRVEYYEHDFVGRIEGLDHCYDCAAELVILQRYLASPHAAAARIERPPGADDEGMIVVLSELMNVHCSRKDAPVPRTLRYHESAEQRRKWFKPRLYDYDNRKLMTARPANQAPFPSTSSAPCKPPASILATSSSASSSSSAGSTPSSSSERIGRSRRSARSSSSSRSRSRSRSRKGRRSYHRRSRSRSAERRSHSRHRYRRRSRSHSPRRRSRSRSHSFRRRSRSRSRTSSRRRRSAH